MATVEIRLGGVAITDHVIFSRSSFTSVADGNPGSATVVVDNTDRSFSSDDFDAGTLLQLFVDGEREWDGWVMGYGLGWPFQYDDTAVYDETPTFWTINGYDRNLLFQKRIMYNKADPSDNRGLKIWPADTPDKTAITYAMDNYVDLWMPMDIEQIDSPSPWEEFTLGFVSAPMGTLFEDCSEMTGGVYWIGPDRVLYYKSDRTVTAPFSLTDDPSGSDVGYREMNAALDFTGAATEALVWGAGKGSDEPVFAKYTNDTAVSTYGLWQWGDYYPGAWLQQTVNRRARTYVIGSPTHRRGHDEPVPTATCTIFTPGIRAGMVADFNATLFGYQENLPVRKVNMTFPTPSEVKYDLELSLKVDTPFGIPDPWWKTEPEPDPFREIIPWQGPGPDPDDGGGVSDNLIDHFDHDYGGDPHCGQVIGSATTESPAGATHTINLPDGDKSVGRTIVLFVLYDGAVQPTQTSVVDWSTELGGGFGDPTAGSVYAYARVIDGTEGYAETGATIEIDGNSTGKLWAYTELLGTHLPADTDVDYTFFSLTPPVLDPGWTTTDSRRYAFAYTSNGGLGDDSGPWTNMWDVSADGYASVMVNATTTDGGSVDPVDLFTSVMANFAAVWHWAIRLPYCAQSLARIGSAETSSPSGATHTVHIPDGAKTVGRTVLVFAAWEGPSSPTEASLASWSNNSIAGGGTSGSSYNFQVYGRVIDGTEGYADTGATVDFDGNSAGKFFAYVELLEVGVHSGGTAGGYAIASNDPPSALGTWDSGDHVRWYSWGLSQYYAFTGDPLTELVFDNDGGKSAFFYWRVNAQDSTSRWIDPPAYSGGGSAATAHTFGLHFDPALGFEDAAVLMTPPPSVTGAPWAGGNHYRSSFSTATPLIDTVVDSTVSADRLWFRLFDYDKIFSDDYAPGELYFGDENTYEDDIRYPWGAWSTEWYGGQDDGVDILIKWKFTGASDWTSTQALSVELELFALEPGGTGPQHVWMMESEIQVGRYRLYMERDAWHMWQSPSWDRATWGDAFPHYAISSADRGYEVDEWYWTRFKVDPPIFGFGHPYTDTGWTSAAPLGTSGYGSLYMKTWKYGDPEPTSKTIIPYFHDWYLSLSNYEAVDVPSEGFTISGDLDGWDAIIPVPWIPNWNGDTEDEDLEYTHNANTIRVAESPANTGQYVIDGMWAYRSYLDEAGGTNSSTEIPVYDNTEHTQASTYVTSYPYVPGTLEIWFGGVKLIRGQDYIESEPASGLFILNDQRDLSTYLVVVYERWGSDATSGYTGGGVYRPAPVLQYGWGSALDGYNCGAAAGCMALDRHTLGANTAYRGTPPATPPVLRSYQNDQVGGIDLWDIATAWSNGWGKTLYNPSNNHTWATFVSLVNQGRGAILSGTYGNLPASKRFSASYTGGHAIYINEQFSNGNFWGMDPLYRYPVIYTAAELQAYAIGFVSAGLITAAFTQVT